MKSGGVEVHVDCRTFFMSLELLWYQSQKVLSLKRNKCNFNKKIACPFSVTWAFLGSGLQLKDAPFVFMILF